ncbi:MAG: HU family DNA-binding protein [Synergistes sp.]|nr:HU family DNA-binding protein [Synergistes sp.]MCR5336066.1 HU family DNA-binding protein [Synergistes sp.]
MTKTDLISAIAKEVEGITKKKAAEVVEAVFNDIHDSLKKEEKVQIVGFGTFEVQKRAARQGRNPQNPEKVIQIPAKNVPVFRAGKALKEAVNEAKKPAKAKKK